jgi:uncharacterized membrane protein YtjA (UPF0391 family)
MLRLAIAFLVLALIAGLFGFGLVASMSYEIARVLFFLFLVLFVVALIGNLASGRARPSDIV